MEGILLDFHISTDAREKLLGQIALRAQSQVFRVLHSVYVASFFGQSSFCGMLISQQPPILDSTSDGEATC
jgi:hypothetical protein